jgi:RNA polymerase sigma-70 factor (ECF subfamily)
VALSLPDGLAASTARAASRLAAGRSLAGVVPAGVSSLVAGVSRTMTLTKLGIASTLIAFPVLVAAALAAQSPRPRPRDAASQGASASPLVAQKAAEPTSARPAEESQSPTGAATNDELFQPFPPIVLKTIPATGATDVDPALTEIRVTFSKEMQNGSWSWVTLDKERFPEITGKVRYEKDRRTCVLPVKLEPGKNYAISVNSQRFANFRDTEGNRAVPYMLLFRTRK